MLYIISDEEYLIKTDALVFLLNSLQQVKKGNLNRLAQLKSREPLLCETHKSDSVYKLNNLKEHQIRIYCLHLHIKNNFVKSIILTIS
jgi:hypothetical protein